MGVGAVSRGDRPQHAPARLSGEGISPPAGEPGRGRGRWVWVVHVLAVYAISRLSTAGLFLLALSQQEASEVSGVKPDYSTFVGAWYDGAWYRAIADHGYPTQLPHDGSGAVAQNVWAFYPLYPMVIRACMTLTGGSWVVVAPLLLPDCSGPADGLLGVIGTASRRDSTALCGQEAVLVWDRSDPGVGLYACSGPADRHRPAGALDFQATVLQTDR
jgi:hypothetical protein